MARTNVDIDEDACRSVMNRYGLTTKRAAVNFALREVAGVLSLEDARQMQGTGWDGDLDEFRGARVTTS
jgi:Arc/MetJ family transcription regulator